MPRVWTAIVAATLINLPFGSLYAFSVFLKPLEEALGASRFDLSIVFGLATITFTVGMNAAPRLFALVSAPILVALCSLAATAGIVMAALATSLVELGIGYGVLFGIGGGVAYIAMQQGVNLMLRSRHGLVNGYIVGLYPAGAMIAAPLFGWALALWGLRATMLGLAGALALTGLLAVAFVVLGGVRLQAVQGGSAPSGAAPPRRVFWQMAAVFFLAAAAGLMVLSQLKEIIVVYGGGTALALFATTAVTGAIAGARLGGGWLLDRFSVPQVMAFAHLWSLLGVVALTLLPSPLMAAIGLGMIGMGYGFISGSTAGGVAYYWPAGDYGRVASRLYVAWCVAAISLPLLAGHLYDLTGGYATVVMIAGAGNLLGIVIALGLPRQSPKTAPAAT